MKMKDRRILPQSMPSKDNFRDFLEGFQAYEKEILIRKAQDEFLDAYSRWLKTRALKEKLTAIRKGMKLESVDVQFSLKCIFPLK